MRLVINQSQDGSTRFDATFESRVRVKPIRLTGTFTDIVNRLRVEGLVLNNNLLKETLSAVFYAVTIYGRVEFREGP